MDFEYIGEIEFDIEYDKSKWPLYNFLVANEYDGSSYTAVNPFSGIRGTTPYTVDLEYLTTSKATENHIFEIGGGGLPEEESTNRFINGYLTFGKTMNHDWYKNNLVGPENVDALSNGDFYCVMMRSNSSQRSTYLRSADTYGNWKDNERAAFESPVSTKNTHEKYLHVGGSYIAGVRKYFTGSIRNFRVFNYTKEDRSIPAQNVTVQNLPRINDPFTISLDVNTSNSDELGVNNLLGFGDFEMHMNSKTRSYTIGGNFSRIGYFAKTGHTYVVEVPIYSLMNTVIGFVLEKNGVNQTLITVRLTNAGLRVNDGDIYWWTMTPSGSGHLVMTFEYQGLLVSQDNTFLISPFSPIAFRSVLGEFSSSGFIPSYITVEEKSRGSFWASEEKVLVPNIIFSYMFYVDWIDK